jgi:CRISPR system Cascade subunit CasA
MNLLTDPWVPVHRDGRFRHLTYRDLLCQNEDWQVALPRDDLEMACLQLLIALTQCLFTPKDLEEWLERQQAPQTEAAFDAATEPYLGTFDLAHPEHPCMQTRGVTAKDITPIQKLFVGLPEGNNHALFNGVGEIRHACASCTAIALYNQAATAPSFGGGFKAGLRGMAPITTLIMGEHLRQTVWRNVLHEESLDQVFPGWHETDGQPVWLHPIAPGSTEHGATIGLTRGYFWQPAKIDLLPPEPAHHCDCCGADIPAGYSGLRKEKFNYTVAGLWPHPLSPRKWATKKGVKEETFLTFTTTAPAWTQLSQFVLDNPDPQQGFVPAPVVSQFKAARLFHGEPLYLLVGGYRNKQAAVLERRHELFTLAAGWADHGKDLHGLIDIGLAARDALRGSLFRFFKRTGLACHEAGQAIYYRQSERLIHTHLRELNFDQYQTARAALARDLTHLARGIFEDQTAPYCHRPEIDRAVAQARASLNAKLHALEGGDRVADA